MANFVIKDSICPHMLDLDRLALTSSMIWTIGLAEVRIGGQCLLSSTVFPSLMGPPDQHFDIQGEQCGEITPPVANDDRFRQELVIAQIGLDVLRGDILTRGT